MEKSDVVKALNEGVVTVEFTKVNGEYRKMDATLRADILPLIKEGETQTARKKSDESLSVWDVNADGWRSFRWDKVQAVNGVKF